MAGKDHDFLVASLAQLGASATNNILFKMKNNDTFYRPQKRLFTKKYYTETQTHTYTESQRVTHTQIHTHTHTHTHEQTNTHSDTGRKLCSSHS